MFWYFLGIVVATTWAGALTWAGLIEGRKQDRITREELAQAKLHKIEGEGGLKSAA